MKHFVTVFTLAILFLASDASAFDASSFKAPRFEVSRFERDLDIDSNWFKEDSSYTDSLLYDITDGGFFVRKRRSFLITEIEAPRQYQYMEPFSIIEFNRVDGFFLGLGSSNMADFGRHDELGVSGGFGYGFEDERWQYFMGLEYRVPLGAMRDPDNDSTDIGLYDVPMTLAFGGEFHNRTSTPDHWRARQAENTQYAFWAREDFRDYYKLAGWSAYTAFRPMRNRELRVEYRNDHYEQRDQTVFYGRFGGNKRLPTNPHETIFTARTPEGNPSINPGSMNSVLVTYQGEGVEERSHEAVNLIGDSVEYDQLYGFSTLVQAEFGKVGNADLQFNKYMLDFRSFQPIVSGLAFDARLRFEASTSGAPFQKLSALGGPGSMPAMDYKEMIGNRLLLLNTEIRVHLATFSSVFSSTDMQLAILNDFGYVAYEPDATSIFEGFGRMVLSTIAYNIGVALGHVSGLQVGSYWRTDRDDDAHLFFRLERPF